MSDQLIIPIEWLAGGAGCINYHKIKFKIKNETISQQNILIFRFT